MAFDDPKRRDFFLPPSALSDQRVRSRFIGVYRALLALAGMIWGIIPFYIWVRGPIGSYETAGMIAALIAPFVGIFVIRITARLVLGMLLTTALTTAGYLIIAFYTGGLTSFVIPWFMCNLAVQGLFGSKRALYVTYVALIAEFGFLLALGQLGLLPADNTPPENREWAFVLSLFTAVTAMALVSTVSLSHRQNSKSKLRASLDKAEAANRAKSVFLSNMSHELRTPLNAIIGFGGMLQLYIKDKPKEQLLDWADSIVKAGSHLSELIGDVLDLARVENDDFDLHFETLQPGEVVKECYELTVQSAEEKGINISGSPDSCRLLSVDRRRFRQIMLNLFSNAIKYTEAGGSISFGCSDLGDDQIRLYVSDTGRGIDEDDHIRIFTPFFRTKGSHNLADGAGVGLALVAQLCSAMEGRVHLESTPGEGSTFYVDFPAVEPDQEAAL